MFNDSGTFISGVARTIGPLVKYYRSTGHAAALELALRLKEKAIGYLFVAEPPLNRPITIAFELPTEEIVLAHRTREIKARLRGDEVAAMESFSADLTFFEPL